MTEVTGLTSGIPTDEPHSALQHTGHRDSQQADPHRLPPALLSSPPARLRAQSHFNAAQPLPANGLIRLCYCHFMIRAS
ncbi:hypothetical protein GBF38_020280 [Nibea albiflora]|uniref:Uncharacterized protein n=1 Tax=Nibea albiflora TaxID=240163 RepID=A0ACB7FDB5_NIBAL|nr:hypothetical protein GBF38_020280 [Nibea albiflora]